MSNEINVIGPCMSSMGYKKKNFKLVPMKLESGFYIGDLGELIVSFGGRIGVGSKVFNEDGNLVKELVVMELEKPHEIGADLTNEEMPENKYTFPILFDFRDDKSIDILIEHLQSLKQYKKDNEQS